MRRRLLAALILLVAPPATAEEPRTVDFSAGLLARADTPGVGASLRGYLGAAWVSARASWEPRRISWRPAG
jgi:hypothetical protein